MKRVRDDTTHAQAVPTLAPIARAIVFFFKPTEDNGYLSQWHKSDFIVDDIRYNCAEQYMMAQKAQLFGDVEALAKIMKSPSPRYQKRIGRTVRNFDGVLWDSKCIEMVYQANLHKFQQEASLRARLEATGTRPLAEASPYDRIWGIGLARTHKSAATPALWKGKNQLGHVLERVREALMSEEKI